MTKTHKPQTVLVLGASGMLGHMLVRVLSEHHQVTRKGKLDRPRGRAKLANSRECNKPRKTKRSH
jgi:NADPH:quinone reductase-like Zn-dependent oxidoreductase